MKKSLPWSNLSGDIYTAEEVKKREPWVKVCAWGMSIFILIGGIYTRYYFLSVFGVLYILTLLMEKSVVVTGRGIETFHEMKITTNYEIWEWKDVVAISEETNPKYPELVALYFIRNNRTKRLFFRKEDKNAIIKIARSGNPNLNLVVSRGKK